MRSPAYTRCISSAPEVVPQEENKIRAELRKEVKLCAELSQSVHESLLRQEDLFRQLRKCITNITEFNDLNKGIDPTCNHKEVLAMSGLNDEQWGVFLVRYSSSVTYLTGRC